MILLDWDGNPSMAGGVVLLFGSGLIGTALASALQNSGVGTSAQRHSWSWPEPDPAELTTIEAAARDALAARKGARFTAIWAAGRSGFGSGPEEMAEELLALEHVLQMIRRIGASLAPTCRAFVHVSSAGGLFEGQVACDRTATPAPLRPYGHGKLAQEHRIRTDGSLGHRLILRPSSVYGYARGARRGLVSALVASAIQHRQVTIFGSLTTQRDYIYAPDVGRFVADRVLQPPSISHSISTETCLLASARPASIFEILRLVEGCLGRSLHLRIDPRPENARDNTFLPSVLPEGFRPTGLHEGVALTASAVTQERFMGMSL
jgi:UDP-glucose 4-epimerase